MVFTLFDAGKSYVNAWLYLFAIVKLGVLSYKYLLGLYYPGPGDFYYLIF
jgi:hypothetical protein